MGIYVEIGAQPAAALPVDGARMPGAGDRATIAPRSQFAVIEIVPIGPFQRPPAAPTFLR